MAKGAEKQKLSEAEISMILDTYMYMDYKEAMPGTALRQVISQLKTHPDYGGGGIHHGEYQVLEQAVEYEQIGELSIHCQSSDMGYDPGTAAVTFVSGENISGADTVYVVYRGTGDGEWMDNGIGMTSEATLQQTRAGDYFEEAAKTLDIKPEQRVIVTGHSKGGNKAQFVTMDAENGELIDICYSVDGQGFSQKAITSWQERHGQEEYADRIGKLHGICGENDFVNVLGNSIIPREQMRYVKTPVENSNFAGFHDIKYMFASLEYDPVRGDYRTVFHGRKNGDAVSRGKLGNYAAALSGNMMELDREQLDGCAGFIMQLMECTGGRKGGINGEKLSWQDLADFTLMGIPLITASLLEEGEGRTLLGALFGKETLTARLRGNVEIYVEKTRLCAKTQAFMEVINQMNETILQIHETAKKIPIFMKGSTILYLRMRGIAKAMEKQTDQLGKMAKAQEQTALMYEKWQNSS